MHHTKTKGDLGVAKTIADLADKDYFIFLSFTEHLPFDLLAMKDSKFYRIQVKYRAGESVLLAGKTVWNDKLGSHINKYNSDDFDYYAIYLPDIKKVIYPSIKFINCTIRTAIPKSPTPFYWYEDFLNLTDEAPKHILEDFGLDKSQVLREKNFPKEVLSRRRAERPSKEDLQKMLWEIPTVHIAKQFGVSDKAIEKWAKTYDIKKPPRGYWSKLKTSTT